MYPAGAIRTGNVKSTSGGFYELQNALMPRDSGWLWPVGIAAIDADAVSVARNWPALATRRLLYAHGVESGKGFIAMQQQGTVKFFNTDKGYGFIKPADGGRDIFVHVSAVEAAGLTTLPEGAAISFDIEPDKKGKGPKAVNLLLTTASG